VRRLAVLLPLVVAGCVAARPEPPSTLFLPDSAGLAVQGSPLRVDFGRAPEGVIAALSRELGAPSPRPLAACPADIERQLAWGDLVLTFTRDAFVGWRRGDAMAGRGCG